MATAAERWREDLAAWAIPEPILAAAPESPWGYPKELFARRADAASSTSTPSVLRAREALPPGGTVVDVGCGAGAASLPLVPPAARLVGVDPSTEMLEAFRERASRAGAEVETIQGAWPDAAGETPSADVVVCAHVVYNVPALAPFALALTDHARARVVLELTSEHPQSGVNDLWRRFHGLVRPTRPIADDAVGVLREAGLSPEREEWTPEEGGGFGRLEDLVAWTRRRLCLTPDRDSEVEAAIADRLLERDGLFTFPPRPVVTLWWSGMSDRGGDGALDSVALLT